MQTLTIDRRKKYTVADFLEVEEELCQLIEGNLIMSPAPRTNHQEVLGNLNEILRRSSKGLGKVFFAPFDVYLNTSNVFQPDLVFISKENNHLISERGLEGAPDLVVEVISPSNSYMDRYTKKRKYFEFGVKEYWIVDPANETLELYVLNQENYDEPHLYLVKEGKVSSTVIKELEFDLMEVFKDGLK